MRNVRRSAIEDLRSFEKESLISEDDSHRGQEDVQKLTDKYIEQVTRKSETKEQEIMAV